MRQRLAIAGIAFILVVGPATGVWLGWENQQTLQQTRQTDAIMCAFVRLVLQDNRVPGASRKLLTAVATSCPPLPKVKAR